MLGDAGKQRITRKREYEAALPSLRSELLAAHLALRGRRFPVLVIVSGAEGSGKGELVQRLNEWLDPRGVDSHAFWEVGDEERGRPEYWRFWRVLPAHGRVGIFFGSWYSEPIVRRVRGETKRRELDRSLERIARFEAMLVEDGALVVKLWLHLSRKRQRKALQKLEERGRISPLDWEHFALYDRFRKVSELAIRATHAPEAPWHVVEARDRRHRELLAGKILLGALAARLAGDPAPTGRPRAAGGETGPSRVVLEGAARGPALSKAATRKLLQERQARVSELAWDLHRAGRSVVMVFEGCDAAGKGGAIRRVTQAMDPRLYQVVGVAAPTDEERAHHYLWRFWRSLPKAGYVTIFDRSWYGRVLVERVEGFATEAEWERAYGEIADFEEQLVEHGTLLLKFWIHITKEEQLRRFEERQRVPHKRHKITEEDWRNRERWDAYERAVEEMTARCSPRRAPWTLVPGDDKRAARLQVVTAVMEGLERVR